MKLEQLVCSLELAKRLKELGVKQQSYFWYMKPDPKYRDKYDLDHTTEITPFIFLGEARAIGLAWCLEDYSAFTVTEIGELLPASMMLGDNRVFLLQMSRKDGTHIWDVGYMKWNVQSKFDWADVEMTQRGDTEADARAKMLIYLIENMMVTP